MTGPGTAALPEGGRIDFDVLRTGRKARLLQAMHDHAIDLLVLGRPANITYASGARQLWTSGSRPFSPSCLVERTGRVHLLSTWDEGVPADVAHEDMFGLSWNPAVTTARVGAIEAIATAARIGTDGVSPGFARLVSKTSPSAELCDGWPALRAARSRKTPQEVACIATACAIAEGALDAMAKAVAAGASDGEILAAHAERAAQLGAPALPTESVCRRLDDGRVALSAGALYAGYEGAIGRVVDAEGARLPAPEAFAAALALCSKRPLGPELFALGATAVGLGLGVEWPVIDPRVDRHAKLSAGMVLALTVAGHTDTVHITEAGPVALSR